MVEEHGEPVNEESAGAPKPVRRRRTPRKAPASTPQAEAQAEDGAAPSTPQPPQRIAPEQADGAVPATQPEAQPAPKPVRRRRKPPTSEAPTPPDGAPPAPEPIAAAPSSETAAAEPPDEQRSEEAQETPQPHRRRRRGRRGGAGRRRQTAEQEVAGIPPLESEAAEALVPEAVAKAEEEAEETPGRSDRRRGGRRAKKLGKPTTELAKSKDIPFMHPSEREFAHLLDYYGIKYLYEPRSFPLKWEGERVVQMFTPDFYLPEYDQYFELTTMKQNLVTQKNRKLRQVREMYPDVNIQLLYRRDLMRLMGKYGFGPLAEVSVEGTERVLFTEEQVRARVQELGKQITKEYAGREPVLIGVLRGVVVFMADLMREIDLPMQIEFMEISHYGEEREESIEVIRDAGTDVIGRDVILVEDIVDTGLTLRYLLEHLQAKKPASVSVCAFLDKSVRRMVDVPIDYVGFEVPDEFVIGYGLDYGGRYRNLRYIGVLKPAEPKAIAQR